MKRQLIAIIEDEQLTLNKIEDNDVGAVSEYVDGWSHGDLSLGLPLAVVAYEVCDTISGVVQGIVVIVEDFE